MMKMGAHGIAMHGGPLFDWAISRQHSVPSASRILRPKEPKPTYEMNADYEEIGAEGRRALMQPAIEASVKARTKREPFHQQSPSALITWLVLPLPPL